jgi:nicotinate phosphoribosyltransferase
MQQVVFHKFSNINVKYAFKLRNYPAGTLLPFKDEIEEEISNLSNLRLSRDELDYLHKIDFLHSGYLEFLRCFRFNPSEYVRVFEEDGELAIEIEGPWLSTILFEVPILAIVSEIWSTANYPSITEGKIRLFEKMNFLDTYEKPIQITDFGTRRRYSGAWQRYSIGNLMVRLPKKFIGTSNVMLAKELGLKYIGTMAHEYIQAMQALVRILDSQKFAFQTWADVYRGRLGIALTDTLGMKAFLQDFDLYFAKLFDGCRQDSGDPFQWGEDLIAHYNSLRIDSKTKIAVFSDSLTPQLVMALNDRFNDRINCQFGIGTNFTNDMGFKPLNIVIKMIECEGRPVAKISDSKGKEMCRDPEYVKYLKSVFHID